MATIVILEHRLHKFLNGSYTLYPLAERWRSGGHRVHIHYGCENPPPGDLAILHLDLSVVPAEYRPLVAMYPRVVNAAVLDIRKSTFSQNMVDRDSDWKGPVIVKTDANSLGGPERRLNRLARSGRTLRLFTRREKVGEEIPTGPSLPSYEVFASPRDVPFEFWTTPGLVVEKFLPEQDERGFYLRVWTFLGDRERSSRCRATEPYIKSGNVIERESVPVPDEIRAWRERLGFDYGKFDYVLHQGRPVLLDVNRTPGPAPKLPGDQSARSGFLSLAEGLNVFLS